MLQSDSEKNTAAKLCRHVPLGKLDYQKSQCPILISYIWVENKLLVSFSTYWENLISTESSHGGITYYIMHLKQREITLTDIFEYLLKKFILYIY